MEGTRRDLSLEDKMAIEGAVRSGGSFCEAPRRIGRRQSVVFPEVARRGGREAHSAVAPQAAHEEGLTWRGPPRKKRKPQSAKRGPSACGHRRFRRGRARPFVTTEIGSRPHLRHGVGRLHMAPGLTPPAARAGTRPRHHILARATGRTRAGVPLNATTNPFEQKGTPVVPIGVVPTGGERDCEGRLPRKARLSAPRVALLIDTENMLSADPAVLVEMAERHGRIHAARAYADWRDPSTHPFAERSLATFVKLEMATRCVSGKNTSDGCLIADAVDLMKKGATDVFVIATADSDFRHLLQKLRSAGSKVVLATNRKNVSFLAPVCDEVLWIPSPGKGEAANARSGTTDKDAEAGVAAEGAVEKPQGTNAAPCLDGLPKRQVDWLVEAWRIAAKDEAGWSPLASIANSLGDRRAELLDRFSGASRLIRAVSASCVFETKNAAGGDWIIRFRGEG